MDMKYKEHIRRWNSLLETKIQATRNLMETPEGHPAHGAALDEFLQATFALDCELFEYHKTQLEEDDNFEALKAKADEGLNDEVSC